MCDKLVELSFIAKEVSLDTLSIPLIESFIKFMELAISPISSLKFKYFVSISFVKLPVDKIFKVFEEYLILVDNLCEIIYTTIIPTSKNNIEDSAIEIFSESSSDKSSDFSKITTTDHFSLGIGANITSKEDSTLSKLFSMVEPSDLVRFGMIPEFIGRVPVIATPAELDEATLVNILTQPKNALTKQYAKLLEYDGVNLEFEPEALDAIAKEAIKRNTGARGLRAIIEQTMLDVMYELPNDKTIGKCVVTKDTIVKGEKPLLVHSEKKVESA